jgi:hypothetical protein
MQTRLAEVARKKQEQKETKAIHTHKTRTNTRTHKHTHTHTKALVEAKSEAVSAAERQVLAAKEATAAMKTKTPTKKQSAQKPQTLKPTKTFQAPKPQTPARIEKSLTTKAQITPKPPVIRSARSNSIFLAVDPMAVAQARKAEEVALQYSDTFLAKHATLYTCLHYTQP